MKGVFCLVLGLVALRLWASRRRHRYVYGLDGLGIVAKVRKARIGCFG